MDPRPAHDDCSLPPEKENGAKAGPQGYKPEHRGDGAFHCCTFGPAHSKGPGAYSALSIIEAGQDGQSLAIAL